MNVFKLKVLSQIKTLFEGDVIGVFIPTCEGEIEVLKGHAPLIAQLKSGDIRLVFENREERISISSGFLNVGFDKTSIVVV